MRSTEVRGAKGLYSIRLSGRQLYQLCRLLEVVAKKEDNYTELKVAVFLETYIRQEARAAGWGKDINPEENWATGPLVMPG